MPTDTADAAPVPLRFDLEASRRDASIGHERTKKSLERIAGRGSAAAPPGSPAPGGATDDPRTRTADLIGLWAGVDLDDGSFSQRAITCERDRTCRGLGSDQFFSFCPGSEGRGLLEGEGRIEDGVLNLPVCTLTCANGDGVGFPTTFSLDRRNGTPIEDTDGPPATFSFHRLSPRVRDAADPFFS